MSHLQMGLEMLRSNGKAATTGGRNMPSTCVECEGKKARWGRKEGERAAGGRKWLWCNVCAKGKGENLIRQKECGAALLPHGLPRSAGVTLTEPAGLWPVGVSWDTAGPGKRTAVGRTRLPSGHPEPPPQPAPYQQNPASSMW